MTVEDHDELLNDVIRMAIFAADNAVIGRTFRTRAEEVRAAVTAAFQLAAGNGLIRLAPRDERPELIAMTPPYTPPPRRPAAATPPEEPRP